MGKQEKATGKTYNVRLSENALLNIEEITSYIAFINHQPLNAIKVGDDIFETIARIEANPLAFKECEEIPTVSKMYRKALCHSWSIIYKIVNTNVIVLGIIHNARKPSKTRALRKVK